MICIIGDGGHAGVLKSLITAGMEFYCITTDQEPKPDDDLLLGIGSNKIRREVFRKYGAKRFLSVICKTAFIAPNVRHGHGAQIMSGAIIQVNTVIGDNVIINTGAQVDHDCIIEDHVFIAPGAIILGGCTIKEGAFIGAGAIIIEGKSVMENRFVKAGKVYQ